MKRLPMFLGCLLLCLAALGQQPAPRMPLVGYVSGAGGPTFEAFRDGLRRAGYVEGRDLEIDARFSDGKPERFPDLIGALLARKVDVLVAGSPPGATAAIRADTTTPIVIAGVVDPAGQARSLGRPAAHITGTSLASQGLAGRWIEALQQVRPGIAFVAMLATPGHPQRAALMKDLADASSRSGVEVRVHDVANAAALDGALEAIAASDAQALIVSGDPVFLGARDKLVAFAAGQRLPAVYFSKLFADAGGLVGYGGSLEDSYRKAARYVDGILKGARPAELPIEPTTVDLVLNRKAARGLGIELPASLVARATQVID